MVIGSLGAGVRRCSRARNKWNRSCWGVVVKITNETQTKYATTTPNEDRTADTYYKSPLSEPQNVPRFKKSVGTESFC